MTSESIEEIEEYILNISSYVAKISVLETKTSDGNQYIYIAKNYILIKTGNITKLLIKDINEKTIVYILYNEIKINDFNENDVLAFK